MIPRSTSRTPRRILPTRRAEASRRRSPGSAYSADARHRHPQVETALRHPKMKLIANALGTPPREVVDQIHGAGRLVAALCGSVKAGRQPQGRRCRHHHRAGTEGGGHTGEIGSMVLWPEVIDACRPLRCSLPAASAAPSDRRALALGAQGVWTGSLWLTVAEPTCRRADGTY